MKTKLYTIADEIAHKETAIKDPSTWKDERAALRSEWTDLKADLRRIRELAPELLAIVKQLAYGSGVPIHDQVHYARVWLRSNGLLTSRESRLSDGAPSYEWPQVNFYNPWR